LAARAGRDASWSLALIFARAFGHRLLAQAFMRGAEKPLTTRLRHWHLWSGGHPRARHVDRALWRGARKKRRDL